MYFMTSINLLLYFSYLSGLSKFILKNQFLKFVFKKGVKKLNWKIKKEKIYIYISNQTKNPTFPFIYIIERLSLNFFYKKIKSSLLFNN